MQIICCKREKNAIILINKKTYGMRNGGIDMADIYEFVSKSSNRRPVYTSHELSKMVRDKRTTSKLDVSEFAAQHGIASDMLTEIEAGKCSFSPQMYKICGRILNLTPEELLAEIVDDEKAVNYRVSDSDQGIKDTFDKANMLFNEIIMQKKIGIN